MRRNRIAARQVNRPVALCQRGDGFRHWQVHVAQALQQAELAQRAAAVEARKQVTTVRKPRHHTAAQILSEHQLTGVSLHKKSSAAPTDRHRTRTLTPELRIQPRGLHSVYGRIAQQQGAMPGNNVLCHAAHGRQRPQCKPPPPAAAVKTPAGDSDRMRAV